MKTRKPLTPAPASSHRTRQGRLWAIFSLTAVSLLTVLIFFVSNQPMGTVYKGEIDLLETPFEGSPPIDKKRHHNTRTRQRKKDTDEPPSKAVAVTSSKRKDVLNTAHRPKLNALIKDTEEGITGDVRFLLDFAILGHAKCATSFMIVVEVR
jgi:hypothetical protein